MPTKISVANKPPVIEVTEMVKQAACLIDKRIEIDIHVNCKNSFIAAEVCYYSNKPVRIPVYARYMDKSVDETAAEIVGQAIVTASQAAAEDISF